MANLLYRIRLGPVYTYPHILISKTDIFPLVLRRCPHVKGFSGTKSQVIVLIVYAWIGETGVLEYD